MRTIGIVREIASLSAKDHATFLCMMLGFVALIATLPDAPVGLTLGIGALHRKRRDP
jgi:hypothetical protein